MLSWVINYCREERLKEIPNRTGVYLFFDKNQAVIYVGKALRLRERISSYFKAKDHKTQLLGREIYSYQVIEVSSEVEALILEANLIKKYLPKFNLSLRDDKSFLYIVITKEEYPRVLTLRKNDRFVKVKDKFGPFPSAKTTRDVLKQLRRVFPFCTQSPKSQKACFYSHLKLCQPCPAFIKKQDHLEREILRKIYLKNIRGIRRILQGKIDKLVRELEKNMRQYIKEEAFEEAGRINEQIKKINYITKPYYQIGYFLSDPNFLVRQKQKALLELISVLKPYYPKLSSLKRIEGVDISNLLGVSATGSLVVFINGEKEPSLYKRFKIKALGPNDVVMVEEVLRRRLKHKEWDYPELLIIDGGKPQLSQVLKLKKQLLGIAIVGLAKKEEEIIIPTDGSYATLSLSRNSSALRLVQEIRDESHRFARKYHRLLRNRLTVSGLT